MKITRRQLRRIIKEATQNVEVARIEDLIYSGEFDLANAQLGALGKDLPLQRGHNPELAKELEREYDRLLGLLYTERKRDR